MGRADEYLETHTRPELDQPIANPIPNKSRSGGSPFKPDRLSFLIPMATVW